MAQREDLKGLRVAIAVYLLLFAMKLSAYFMTGVMALLAEALHTMSDLIISVFLLIAARYSARGADSEHPFGHGRAQNVAALIAATLFISFTSFELFREAAVRLTGHETVIYQNVNLAVGVLVVSMIIAALPLIKLFRQKARGPAAKAQLLELFNDELGHVAALAGTVFILFGVPAADPVAAMVVAGIIAFNAAGLMKENASFLLGRSPGATVLKQIEESAGTVPGVIGIHDLRAEYIGNEKIHVTLHINTSPALSVVEAHAIAKAVADKITPLLEGGFCNIHVDVKEA